MPLKVEESVLPNMIPSYFFTWDEDMLARLKEALGADPSLEVKPEVVLFRYEPGVFVLLTRLRRPLITVRINDEVPTVEVSLVEPADVKFPRGTEPPYEFKGAIRIDGANGQSFIVPYKVVVDLVGEATGGMFGERIKGYVVWGELKPVRRERDRVDRIEGR